MRCPAARRRGRQGRPDATSTGPSSAASTPSRSTTDSGSSRSSAASSPTASTSAKRSPHEIEGLGIPLERDLHNWYGEPAQATRDEFYRQARLMRLDDLREKPDTEPLTDRLWRRYGRRAFAMLEEIREDPRMAEDIMGSADYLRVELYSAAGFRDGHQARGLHASPVEDRPRRARRRHRQLAGPRAKSPRSSSATMPTSGSPSTSVATTTCPTRSAIGPGCGSSCDRFAERHVLHDSDRRFLAAPAVFDPGWRPVLVPASSTGRCFDADRARSDGDARRSFVHAHGWEAAKGFELTEDIQVLIAAQASMLLLGLDIDELRRPRRR